MDCENVRIKQIEIHVLNDTTRPSYLDSDFVICQIASDVMDQEQELGRVFEGAELEKYIRMSILKWKDAAIGAYLDAYG